MVSDRGRIARAIYALIDPRDGAVRYVGCAVDVEERLDAHMRERGNTPKCLWLAELRRDGLSPELEILEVVRGFSFALVREEWWIDEMLRAGEPLTNITHTIGQGVFSQQQKVPLKPLLWKGTMLRRTRKELGVTREAMAALAGLSRPQYDRAEGGSQVNRAVALDILEAINCLLRERRKHEVTLDDLGWIPR